jgi:SAM-dependent methyltransferase
MEQSLMPNGLHKSGDYNAAYHAALQKGARISAGRVMPRVLDLIRPDSIVDFGCGSGGWLATAAELGVDDIQGLDGPWVTPELLEIPRERFLAVDLGSPIELRRRFDLALCLEVAEHLPAKVAAILIVNLTTHSPVVLFSAAVPGQGGDGHVNEVWPSVWRELFKGRGFDCFDLLRGAIWEDREIEPWYRQNLLLFADRGRLAEDAGLAARLMQPPAPPLDIAHPVLFGQCVDAATALAAETDRLRCLWQDQNGEIAQLEAALSNLDHQIVDMRGSLSWRVTAPLRALRHAIRLR